MSVTRCRLLAALWALMFAGAGMAQTSRRQPARSANVQSGVLVTVDPAAGTIVLKPRTGPDLTYRITEKTRILRDKKPIGAESLKGGDVVVVRFRRSRVGPPSLYDVADKTSWEWLLRLRTQITAVTAEEITEDALRAEEGPDASEITYRVSEKTLWGKAGKEASAADYKPGERLFVAPRLLPGGGLMACAAADTAELAARLKERAGATVTGVLTAVDISRRAVSLRSAAGDDRSLIMSPDCAVRQSSRDVPLTALRVGQSVTAHLTRDSEGERVVTRVTIQSRKRPARQPSRKPAPTVAR